MKTILQFTLLSFLFLASCSEDDIRPLEKQCKEIDQHLSSYKLKTLDITGSSNGAGSISGYFKGSDLVFATVESSNDAGREFDEYYFDGEDIMCVKQIAFIYNKPIYYTQEMAAKNGDSTWFDDKKTVEKTTRFFFYEKRMIKWINDNNKEIEDNDRRYKFQRALLLSDVEKLQKMLKGPSN